MLERLEWINITSYPVDLAKYMRSKGLIPAYSRYYHVLDDSEDETDTAAPNTAATDTPATDTPAPDTPAPNSKNGTGKVPIPNRMRTAPVRQQLHNPKKTPPRQQHHNGRQRQHSGSNTYEQLVSHATTQRRSTGEPAGRRPRSSS